MGKTTFIPLVGKRFGRLVVTARAPRGSGSNASPRWNCRCDCGRETVVFGQLLRRTGGTRSCGCLIAESTRERMTRHGSARQNKHTREYDAWQAAKWRCFNPNNPGYRRYGGRGITMCDEWRDSFEAFFAYMGPRPDGHSLDRINNDGNYEPGNCRWASVATQLANRATSFNFFDVDDQPVPLTHAARHIGMNADTLKRLFTKSGVLKQIKPNFPSQRVDEQ